MHAKQAIRIPAERLVTTGVRRVVIEGFTIDSLPDDAVLVRNDYTAISAGTELSAWLNGWDYAAQPAQFPMGMGYCSAGTVIAAGKAVAGVGEGDRVAGLGTHASHDVLTSDFYKVPDGLSSSDASLLTMCAIAQHGVRVARIEIGESVAVLGAGLVGQLALSLARISGGHPVIAIDRDDFRLQKAGERGADICINPGEEDPVERVNAGCVDDGANVVMEATGKPALYPLAAKLACTAGRVISLGSPRGTVEMDFFTDVHLREVSILGAIQPRTPTQGNMYYRWTMQRERTFLLRLMAAGRLDAGSLVTHIEKPEACQDVYSRLADEPREMLGVLFDWRSHRGGDRIH